MPTPEQLAVAERMKEARLKAAVLQKKPISQSAMAQLVGAALDEALHQTQWSRYESGESEPSLRVIAATARVSGLSEAYIAFGEAKPQLGVVKPEAASELPKLPPRSPITSKDVPPQRRGGRKPPTPRKRASNE